MRFKSALSQRQSFLAHASSEAVFDATCMLLPGPTRFCGPTCRLLLLAPKILVGAAYGLVGCRIDSEVARRANEKHEATFLAYITL